jgi:hypothetical protein
VSARSLSRLADAMFTMQAFKAVAVCTDDAGNVRLVSLADGDTEYTLGKVMQASGGKGFACYVLPEEAVCSYAPRASPAVVLATEASRLKSYRSRVVKR